MPSPTFFFLPSPRHREVGRAVARALDRFNWLDPEVEAFDHLVDVLNARLYPEEIGFLLAALAVASDDRDPQAILASVLATKHKGRATPEVSA